MSTASPIRPLDRPSLAHRFGNWRPTIRGRPFLHSSFCLLFVFSRTIDHSVYCAVAPSLSPHHSHTHNRFNVADVFCFDFFTFTSLDRSRGTFGLSPDLDWNRLCRTENRLSSPKVFAFLSTSHSFQCSGGALSPLKKFWTPSPL